MAVTASGLQRHGFVSLTHPAFRQYFAGQMCSMMADNIEHVLSYWVLFQQFHSPVLAGFAVISHWLPSLIFSIHSGALADRYDCRKIILLAQGLFAGASLLWGVLILTDRLELWQALVILMMHGTAVVLWGPASQLMLHDIVGRQHLASAVRLNATGRQLGLLFGPGLGGIMLLALGPGVGLLLNALLYLPLTIWLLRAPYTGHLREGGAVRGGMGFREALRVLQTVAPDRPLVAMIALTGLTSMLVGNSFGAQMPEYAADLGADKAGLSYSVLLGANAAGAVLGGLLLEGTGFLRPRARTALVCTLVWCLVMIGFAMTRNYLVAVALLFVGGVLFLTASSIAQTLAQLLAPPNERGRVLGLFNMAQSGLKVGSGLSIGVLGGGIGIHWSLALSAGLLLLLVWRLWWFLGPKDYEAARLAV